MTRNEIMAIPAGRLLDAAVAEHAMEESVTVEQGEWITDDGMVVSGLPNYSTDIAAAMEVLCEVRGDRGFVIRDLEGGRYTCRIADARVGTGNTISEAICRAALLVMTEAK